MLGRLALAPRGGRGLKHIAPTRPRAMRAARARPSGRARIETRRPVRRASERARLALAPRGGRGLKPAFERLRRRLELALAPRGGRGLKLGNRIKPGYQARGSRSPLGAGED